MTSIKIGEGNPVKMESNGKKSRAGGASSLAESSQNNVDYMVELDARSGIDERLRYTRSGYRRSDDEIRGIMRKRKTVKAEKKKRKKVERKVLDKAKTQLMTKLRGTSFEELSNGDFEVRSAIEIAEDAVIPRPQNDRNEALAERRERHALILEANRRNADIKKKRKLARRIEAEADFDLLLSETKLDVPVDTYVDDLVRSAVLSNTTVFYLPPFAGDFKLTARQEEILKQGGFSYTQGTWQRNSNKFYGELMTVDEIRENINIEKIRDTILSRIDEESPPLQTLCEEPEFEPTASGVLVDSLIDEVLADKKNSFVLPSFVDNRPVKLSYNQEQRLIDNGFHGVGPNKWINPENSYWMDDSHLGPIDLSVKEATMMAQPEKSWHAKFKSDVTSRLKRMWAKTNDKVMLAQLDMFINFVDMLWLSYTIKDTKQRLAIFHLWMGTHGLEFETKIAGTALGGLMFAALNAIEEDEKKNKSIRAESLSDAIDSVTTFAKKAFHASFINSAKDLFLSVASLKLLPKESAMEIYKYFGKAPGGTIVDLAILAMESLSRIIRVVELIISGVPISEALFAKDPIEVATNTGIRLLAMEDNLYGGLPVDGKMCQKEWLRSANEIIPLLKKVVQGSNPFKKNFAAIQQLETNLTLALGRVKGRVNAGSRIPPFCIVLHGPPGIGKSTIMNWLFRIHADVKKRHFEEGQVFHRIVSSDYWEGYDPWSQPYVHYSELGNKNQNIAKVSGDDCVSELISVVDSLPMPLNMAFGEKGRVFFMGECVVIDTNNKGLNLDVIFGNAAAYRRRFIYVEPSVLPEFVKEGGIGIDFEKSKDRRLIDKYSFNCYRQETVDNSKSKVVNLMQGGSADTLYDLLFNLFQGALRREEELLKMKTADIDVEYGSKHLQAEAKVVMKPRGRVRLALVQESIMRRLQTGRTWMTRFLQVQKVCDIASNTNDVVQCAIAKGIFETVLAVNPKKNYDECVTVVNWILFFISLLFFVFQRHMSLITYCTIAFILWLAKSSLANVVHDYKVDEVRHQKDQSLNNAIYKWKREFSDEALAKFIPYTAAAFCAAAGIGSGFMLIKWINNVWSKDIKAEEHTEFKLPSENNEKLNRNEEIIGAMFSQKRISGKQPEVWAVRTIQKPIASTNDCVSLSQSINTNTRYVVISKDDKTSRVMVFGLCNNIAVIPTHAVPEGSFTIYVSTTGFAAENGYKSSIICPKHVIDIGNDMSLISLSQVQFRNVLAHINDVDFKLAQGRIGDSQITVRRAAPTRVHSGTTSYMVDRIVQYDWNQHRVGSCGLPVYINFNKGSFIAGIHCAGVVGTSEAYGSLFSVKAILDGIETLKKADTMMTPVSQADFEINFSDPKSKSPFLHMNLHNVEFYGSDGNAVIMPSASKLQKSKLHFDVDQIFADKGVSIVKQFAPPPMRAFFLNGQYISPQNENLTKINTMKKPLDRVILEECVNHFVDRVVRDLAEKGVTRLAPLTLMEAVNGCSEDAYLRRINVATGAGYGLGGKKRAHLPLVSEEKGEIVREPTDALKKKLEVQQERYFRDESVGAIFGAKLKDEPREIEKVRVGKTRMFYPAELPLMVTSRQVLAPLFTLMVEHRNVFNMSVGINMHAEGQNFYNYFASFREDHENDDTECLFDGDYGGFDTSMPYDIGLAASSFMVSLARKLDYNDDAIKILKGVLSDCLFPIVELNTDVFKVAGLMTSGSYGTAEFNCVRNNILMMYYFATTDGLTLVDYDTKFRKTTYGDDVMGVVKKSIRDKFNNVLYAEYCDKVLGMKFTSPDKTENDVPFRKLSQMNFLKRNFVRHPELDKIMAVLDYESIAKSLKWVIPSDMISPAEQIVATVESALWELFLHLSRADFEDVRTKLIDLVGQRYNFELRSRDVSATWNRICSVICPEAIDLREEEDQVPCKEIYDLLSYLSLEHADQ